VFWSSFQSGVMVRKSFVFPEWYAYAVVPPVLLLLLGIYLSRLLPGSARRPDEFGELR
jgi:hypothetical protein